MVSYWELPNLTVYLIVKTETTGEYIESFNAFQENFFKMPVFITCKAANFQSSQYYISLYVIVLNTVNLWHRDWNTNSLTSCMTFFFLTSETFYA
jgi:hypothetical protein